MRRHALGAGHLHSPPRLVEEGEGGLDELGEALVEAPFVLGVVAVEPVEDPAHRLARVARERGRAAGDGLRQLHAGVEPGAQAAHEVDRGWNGMAAQRSAPAACLMAIHAAITVLALAAQASTASTVDWRGS